MTSQIKKKEKFVAVPEKLSSFFPSLFLDFYFFLGSLFILQLTIIDNNGDRNQERRVRSMQHSIPHSLEKAQRPERID